MSEESYQGLRNYASEHGVSMVALVEALGLVLPAGLPKQLENELLAIARQVTAERRSRHPRD